MSEEKQESRPVHVASVETPFGEFWGEGPTEGQALLAAYVAALKAEKRAEA